MLLEENTNKLNDNTGTANSATGVSNETTSKGNDLLSKISKSVTNDSESTKEFSEKKPEDINTANVEERKAEHIDLDKHEEDLPEEKETSENYAKLNKEELLEKLRDLIETEAADKIKSDVDAIKGCFYNIVNAEKEKIRNELKKGGAEGEIKIPKDPSEDYLKELLASYKIKRHKHAEDLEKEKEENLKKKKDIIEKIKILANGEESLNKTFSEFKELQKLWSEIGNVPSSESSKLWNNYQLQIERFYDFIKINKELRDLDLKKNLESKIELCEKTEDLLLESDVRNAYNKLQEYHNLWKELGPVEQSKREEIWERFSDATKKIRKNYQDYFVKLNKEREDNYKQKIALCEKIESIIDESTPKKAKEWVTISKDILELQKVWKSIGMVPKKVNQEVYDRFRAACNKFFEDKKEFFDGLNEEFDKNLQIKTDICIQAEGIKDNTDWKKTTELFISLQKKWKEVGPVHRKHSDVVWKRFRAACDHFFNAKEAFFSNIIEEQNDNAEKKKEVIEELKNFKPSEDQTENIKRIKEIQNKWISIGMVPNKLKDGLQKDYKNALNELYEKINLSREQVDKQSYKNKIELLKNDNDSKQLNTEKSKINQKIKAIEEDIRLWENNMTFFAGDAKDLLSNFSDKVTKAKEEVESLNNRKKIINVAIRELKQNKEEGGNDK